MRILRRQVYFFSVMLTMLGSMAFGTSAALAQDLPGTPEAPMAVAVVEDTTILVDAATCSTDACPPYDEYLGGFHISAREVGSNTVVAACQTTDAACELVIPGGVNYYLDYAPIEVPTGFVFDRIDISDGEFGPPVHILVFVPESLGETPASDLLVAAATCDAATCPPFASYLGDFAISAYADGTGALLDSCTTASDGSQCELTIPGDVTGYFLQWSNANVPEGYAFSEFQQTDGPNAKEWTIVFTQTASEVDTILVAAAKCDADGVECPPFSGSIDGLTIIAREEGTGNILDSCTNTPDGCLLVIPSDALYYLDYDESGVPFPYKFATVYETDGMTGPRTFILVFVHEEEETNTLRVQAATCDAPECPPFSSFIGSMGISVYAEDGTLLDSCATTQNGSLCFLVIPESATGFYFQWEEDAVPSGYLFDEVYESDGMTGPRVYTLVFIPDSSVETTLHVNAATCTTAECPPYDDFISGIDIFAREDGTNTILDYCTTPANTQNNSCELKVSNDIVDYYLDYAPEGVPAGFVYSHIDVSDGEMGPETFTFVFVPEGSVTPTVTPTHEPTHAPTHPATHTPASTSAAVSNLPSTGATGADGAGSTGLLLATAGVLLAGAFALGAQRLRNR